MREFSEWKRVVSAHRPLKRVWEIETPKIRVQISMKHENAEKDRTDKTETEELRDKQSR